MSRKFFGFDTADILRHISKVKTLEDAYRLAQDIVESETNLCSAVRGNNKSCIIHYSVGDGPFLSHLFTTQKLYDKFKPKVPEEFAGITILPTTKED